MAGMGGGNSSHMPVALFHITHIGNLSSILACKGLWCDAERRNQGFTHVSIAHEHIKERRMRRTVPVPPGGMLGEYVPFYFAARSPMLYTIHRNNVEGYTDGQSRIVHLVTSVEAVVALGHGHCFTDRHAELFYANYFTSLSDLGEKVDWRAMGLTYWSEVKEERQAEFLVRTSVPWSCIEEVGVIDAATRVEVEAVLRGTGARTPVTVRRNWYY